MAVSLEHRAVPPGRERKSKKPKMPEGPGIHINTAKTFGGEVAERGRKIVDLETDKRFVARRSTPPPAPERGEQERPTYTPNPDEIKAQKVRGLIQLSARPIERIDQDDMPTHQPPGFKKRKEAKSKEEDLLSRDSDVSGLTKSFAPPPPISSVIEENIATQVRDNVVPISVAKSWIPPRKRKQKEEKPSIVPTRGSGWSLEGAVRDEAIQDALVMPHASCGRPGSK